MTSWASRIVPVLEELVADLESAGVHASTDRTRVRAPGAWVTASTAGPSTLDGSGTMRAHVLLVAPDTGDAAALATLAGLLDKALAVLDPDEDVDTSVVLPLPTGSTHPAFRVTVDLDL